MFNFFHSIVGKIAVGISSLLIGVAGFISTAPKTDLAPVATSTSEISTIGTTTKPTSPFVPITSAPQSNTFISGKTQADAIKSTCTISVSPTTITQGENAVLSWKTTGVQSNSIAISSQEVASKRLGGGIGGEHKMTDSSVVSPHVSMEYSINAYVGGGKGFSCSVVLTVLPNASASLKGTNTVTTGISSVQPKGTACNGKMWNACSNGSTFYCPTVGGDASCQKNEAPVQNINPTLKNQPTTVDPMISLLDAEFKKQQAKNDEILRQMNIITAKYQPQIKQLNEQEQSLIQQDRNLQTSCGTFGCISGEKMLQSNQLLINELSISSKITALDGQEKTELEAIPGYSSINVSPSASTIPPYDPSVSSITVLTPHGATTLQIISNQSGTYFVADTSTGKSYMISGGSGVYSVSPF